ncbi:MAG: hypothetical protein GW839_13835 [Flavobacteriales bacterium]|nr:hypothetical protein [Flavobacteriales bacterium]
MNELCIGDNILVQYFLIRILFEFGKNYTGLFSLFAESESELKNKNLNFMGNLVSWGILTQSEFKKFVE